MRFKAMPLLIFPCVRKHVTKKFVEWLWKCTPNTFFKKFIRGGGGGVDHWHELWVL